MKKNKEKKIKKKKRIWLLILGILVILSNLVAIYNILRLGPIEELVRYIVIGIFVIIDIIILIRIKKKRKNKEKKVKFLTTFLIIYLLINILISTVIIYAYNSISKINKNYITYSSSLIVKAESEIEEINDVDNLIIGMINDTSSPDGYIIPKEIIKENNLDDTNDIEEYDDYSTMIADLYEGTIDALFISTDYESMFSSMESYANIKNETKIIITKEKEMAKTKTSKRESLSAGKDVTEPFTILLMGVDSTTDGLTKNTIANGDSLILITFNPKTLNATMLSIPRDSYLPIACWSGKPENKITHAAAYGTDCMMSTIENYFDVTIDYYAKINFKGLVTLVDKLGGITVEVPQDLCTDNSNREGTVCINQGIQTLNGEQALVLARNRKQLVAGDLDRGLNQQIVIQGILNKVKDMRSINQVLEILNTITNNLDTNFTEHQILSFYDIAKDIINNALQEEDADLINIEQLYLAGSGQMIYDERARMVLWNYVPNTSSKKAIINAMKINLGLKEPKLIKEFAFSINDDEDVKTITGTVTTGTSTYKLLPDFTGDTEEQARSWANKNGLNVRFEGTSGYVIGQSYPANKRIDLIKGEVVLTLSGNNKEENSKDEETEKESNKKPSLKDDEDDSEEKDDVTKEEDKNESDVEVEVETTPTTPDENENTNSDSSTNSQPTE